MGAVDGLVELEGVQDSALTVDRPFPMFLICWQGGVPGLEGLVTNTAVASLERLCLQAAFVSVPSIWPVPRTL